MQLELEEDAKFLVLCTDGIFEFMGNEDILRYVEQKAHIGWLPSDIAKGLVHRLPLVSQIQPSLHQIDLLHLHHFLPPYTRAAYRHHQAFHQESLEKVPLCQQDIVTIDSPGYHQFVHEVLPVSLCRGI